MGGGLEVENLTLQTLEQYDGTCLSIGITEGGRPRRCIGVPWDRTVTAMNMRLPQLYLSEEEIKAYVEAQLEKTEWKVDVVLSHTAPLKYEPVEDFIPGIDQTRVDRSTEEWLDDIEGRLRYKRWYCGHYHISKQRAGKPRIEVRFLYQDFLLFPKEW